MLALRRKQLAHHDLELLPRDYGFPAQFKIFCLVGRWFLAFDVMGNSEVQGVVVSSHNSQFVCIGILTNCARMELGYH